MTNIWDNPLRKQKGLFWITVLEISAYHIGWSCCFGAYGGADHNGVDTEQKKLGYLVAG